MNFTTQHDLVSLRDISLSFGKPRGLTERLERALGYDPSPTVVHAVNKVNLSIRKGEILGLLGESGCGKSTLGRIVAGLLKPTEGNLSWNGVSTSELSRQERKRWKLKSQMIFQNPYASLNPRMRIDRIVGEAPAIHRLPSASDPHFVDKALICAGLDPSVKKRFPHEFSGGQRQRVGIARALAIDPELLVCDESVAALDVSIQAQIINLLMDLREQRGMTYLFISHDLGVISHISDRVAVMYLGRIVEVGTTDELFSNAHHPYTKALMDELPRVDGTRRDFSAIKGEVPSPLRPPTGCHFHPRCAHAFDRCRIERPELRTISPDHVSACHLDSITV